jgi:hypothetical protein
MEVTEKMQTERMTLIQRMPSKENAVEISISFDDLTGGREITINECAYRHSAEHWGELLADLAFTIAEAFGEELDPEPEDGAFVSIQKAFLASVARDVQEEREKEEREKELKQRRSTGQPY